MNALHSTYSILKKNVLFVILLAVLSGLYGWTLNSHGMFIWDEAEYASIARSVVEGEGFSINGSPNSLRPPILPLSGSAALLVSGSTQDIALKIPVLLFALLGLIALYTAGSILYGSHTALLSCVILGFSPSFWSYTSYFLSEIPFIAFFTAAVLFGHVGIYHDSRFFKYSWAGFGFAVLTRYTAVLFGPILLLMLVIALFDPENRTTNRHRVFSWTFFTAPLVAVIIIAPWLLRQQLTFGSALTGFYQASGQLQSYAPGVAMPWSFYLDRIPEMITWPGTLLLLIGVLWAANSKDRLAQTCLLVSSFLLVWFSVYRYKEVRLITSILPFFALLAAAGSNRVIRAVFPRLDTSLAVVVITLVVGVTSIRISPPRIRSLTALGYPVLTEATAFIRNETPEDAVVMGAIGPQLAWYTHRKTTGIPPRDQLVDALESVDWVIIVNFERGQPAYAQSLIQSFSQDDIDRGKVHLFSNARYTALVVPADELRNRIQ